jgi:hypothetical protein
LIPLFPNEIDIRVKYLPPIIQHFVDEIPGTPRGLDDQDFGLNQLQLWGFLGDIPEEPESIGYIMKLK